MALQGQIIQTSATVDPASVAANTSGETTVTVTGAATGDTVVVAAPDLEDNLGISAYVSAADTVTVRLTNVTAGAIDPASQTMYFAVIS